MVQHKPFLEQLKKSEIAPILFFCQRMLVASRRSFGSAFDIFKIALKSRETQNYTYKLTPPNKLYLALLVASITNKSLETITGYFAEIEHDNILHSFIIEQIKKSHYRYKKDLRCDFGSRLAFYAIIRANKCKIVVENGVEMGIGSIVLCYALAKNKEEGYPGIYYGLDINPDAGAILRESPYVSFVHLLIGDGVNSLSEIKGPIDFYFSDGYRSHTYEQQEFKVLRHYLSDHSMVITNKAIFSTALAETAIEMQKKFTYFQEHPDKHWYQGSGLGFMY